MNEFKVKLISMVTPSERVVFDVMPTLSVSGGVEYSQVSPTHMPGVTQVYKNTQSRTFTITAPLISRTVEEATKNQSLLHQLSAWRYPYFGNTTGDGSSPAASTTAKQENIEMKEDTSQDFDFGSMSGWIDEKAKHIGTKLEELMQASLNEIRGYGMVAKYNSDGSPIATPKGGGSNMLGAPPPVLHLYGWSQESNGDRGKSTKNLNRIPVVLTNLEYTYPDSVDYIPTISGEPWPIKMEVIILLTESHSPRQFETFSLSSYKAGTLRSF